MRKLSRTLIHFLLWCCYSSGVTLKQSNYNYKYIATINENSPNKYKINNICGKKPHELRMWWRHSIFYILVIPPQRSLLANSMFYTIIKYFWAQSTYEKRNLQQNPMSNSPNHTPSTLTVCRSLLNRISATKPAPIPKGARLMNAINLPMRSPETGKCHRFPGQWWGGESAR